MARICRTCSKAVGVRNSTNRMNDLMAANRPFRLAALFRRSFFDVTKEVEYQGGIKGPPGRAVTGLLPTRLLAKRNSKRKAYALRLACMRTENLFLSASALVEKPVISGAIGVMFASPETSASVEVAMPTISSGRRFKIPVGMRDIRMAHICCQGDEVTRYKILLRFTLF